MEENKKSKVLFLGMTVFDLSKDDASLEKKYLNLKKELDIRLVARGEGGYQEKYGCKFWLTPKKFGLPVWFVLAFFRARKVIIENKIETIIAQSPALDGFLAAILKIFTGRKLVVEVHGDWVESLFFYHKIPLAGLVRRLLEFFGRFSLKRADKVRVISGFTEDLAKKYGAKPPFYKFATFVDVDVFLNEKDVSWNPEIVYVGVLYRLKGVHFLVRALDRIQKDFPNVKLTIIGDGPYKKDLEELIEDRGVKNVEFTGWLYINDVRDRIKNGTALVLPSLSEGLGRTLIEAAALGKPIIGSNVGGIPDLIDHGVNGYLFEPGNVSELAASLEKIFSDPERAKRMGEKGQRKMAETFSTSGFFETYFKMIKDK